MPWSLIVLGLLLVTSALALAATGAMCKALMSEPRPDTRTRRRLVSRGFLAVGLWEWNVALCLIVTGSWTNVIALAGMGVLMLVLARHPEFAGVSS